MNLVSASKSLVSKIENISESASSEQIIRTIQPIEGGLNKSIESLESICLIAKHFSEDPSIKFSRANYSFTSVRKKIEPVSKALGDKPEDALKHNRWANCNDSLTAVVKGLEAELKTIWSDFIGDLSHDIRGLEPFLDLGDGAREIKEINAKQGRLTELGRALPVIDVQACIEKAKELSREIGELKASLDFDDANLPDGVIIFIKKVKGFGANATLADLDVEVFEWLKSKDMLKNFKVK